MTFKLPYESKWRWYAAGSLISVGPSYIIIYIIKVGDGDAAKNREEGSTQREA